MALTIVKKPVPQVEVSPAIVEPVVPQKVLVQTPDVTQIETLTSEYIDLYRKYDYFEVKAMVKRMEEIRKQLHTIANETMDNKKPVIFACEQGELEFSERGKVAEAKEPLALINDLTLKFGPEVAASVVGIAITPLRKLLSEFELKKYLTEEPGGRTLKSVRPVG